MNRIALLVGIDHYKNISPLSGCVNDANRLRLLLENHANGNRNFDCKRLVSSPTSNITKSSLAKNVRQLFQTKGVEVALFFFSGHGLADNLDGSLFTQEALDPDDGVSMALVLALANDSPAHEKVIILDCCHSGAMGSVSALKNNAALLGEGVSVLTSSRNSEASIEEDGAGVFTSLVCDALSGGATDVLGRVTASGIYTHAESLLDAWHQRPMFKSHVSNFCSLRNCNPIVPPQILRTIVSYFEPPKFELPLDPSYEPAESTADPKHTRVFAHLQRLRTVNLVEPVGEEHMYWAAVRSKSCRLTPLGVHYWHLVKKNKI